MLKPAARASGRASASTATTGTARIDKWPLEAENARYLPLWKHDAVPDGFLETTPLARRPLAWRGLRLAIGTGAAGRLPRG